MALELADNEKKVIMTHELSGDDSQTAPFNRKHSMQRDASGNPSTSTTKRQKKMLGEQEVHDSVPQGETLAEEDGDLGSNAAESEPGTMEESLQGRVGRSNAGGTTGNQEELQSAKVDSLTKPIDRKRQLRPRSVADELGTPVAKATDTAHQRRVADEFSKLTRILEDLLGRLEGRNKEDVEKALFRAEALEVMCVPGGTHQWAPFSDTIGSPNPEQGNIVRNGSLLAADAAQIGKKERDFETPSSSTSSADGYSCGEVLIVPASVSERQKNDPELREKIHKVETDYWANRSTGRAVYNEERFKLYTEEEVKQARIVWPPREVHSPAGYRENELEFGNHRFFEDGHSWYDTLYEFGCPLKEDNLGGEEEAVKKGLRDKIDKKITDTEAKMAEYDRWEKIREVETEYYPKRISREQYNKQRFSLYTEEEREAKGVLWPHKKHKKCHSPAGFREALFDPHGWREDWPDWQIQMDFHYPYACSLTDTGEEILCEPCIPLVEKHRDFLNARKLRMEERMQEAESRAEWEKHEAKALLEMKEKQTEERLKKRQAKKNGLACAVCSRKFATENALSMHTAAKHKK